MIFVTVGTHEQQFDRLIRAVDALKGKSRIEDEVVIQTGFSSYEPKYCKWSRMLSWREMNKNMEDARIVITHGGPASFLAPLQIGKIPIVVPRQKQYDEHVNNHQVEFCKAVEKRMRNIIVIEDVGSLTETIQNYGEYCAVRKSDMPDHNKVFNERLEKLVEQLGV